MAQECEQQLTSYEPAKLSVQVLHTALQSFEDVFHVVWLILVTKVSIFRLAGAVGLSAADCALEYALKDDDMAWDLPLKWLPYGMCPRCRTLRLDPYGRVKHTKVFCR